MAFQAGTNESIRRLWGEGWRENQNALQWINKGKYGAQNNIVILNNCRDWTKDTSHWRCISERVWSFSADLQQAPGRHSNYSHAGIKCAISQYIEAQAVYLDRSVCFGSFLQILFVFYFVPIEVNSIHHEIYERNDGEGPIVLPLLKVFVLFKNQYLIIVT